VDLTQRQTEQDECPGDQSNPPFKRHGCSSSPASCRYDFFSDLGASSSVLDEHPVATPQVGRPAFRMMNCRTSQMPMTSRTDPRTSMMFLLYEGNGSQKADSRYQRSAFSENKLLRHVCKLPASTYPLSLQLSADG
jgi:hypothetical protein